MTTKQFDRMFVVAEMAVIGAAIGVMLYCFTINPKEKNNGDAFSIESAASGGLPRLGDVAAGQGNE